jgi:EmrB/QacA subfamily drug resistance transporter
MSPFTLSAVNVALPRIEAELGMNAVQLSWISTAYLLATAVFLVPAGRLADIYGRKKVFTLGLAVFTVASALLVFVSSSTLLIAFRTFQGMGTALFVTTGMAILTSVFPVERRGHAMGIYVSAVYLGLSVGPFIGGIMTQHLGWRSLFLLLLPMGTTAIWATLRYLKGEWADARGESFDLLGSLLYGIAILALVYGATTLPSMGAYGMIAGGLAGLVAFAWQEKRIDQPVFDLSLFQTNRTFLFSGLAALINYCATFAIAFLLSLYLQYIKGLQPQAAGTLLVAQPIVQTIFSPMAGRWSDHVPPRLIATIGMAITALGLAVFAVFRATTPLWLIGTDLLLLGFGFALFSSPNMSAIMGSVDKRHYGIASGTVATMRLLGQMASMATATVMLVLYLGHQPIQPSNHDLFIRAMRSSFTIFALLCVIGIYFSFFRGKSVNTSQTGGAKQ